MGLFYVGCRVLNPATSKSTVVRRLMVDTGAESTWIDAAVLEAIGIEARKKDLQFQLANGQIVTRSVGYAVLRVDKAETVDEVVFAQRGDLQLLGARALEGLNLQVDSRRKRLVAAGPIRQCRRRASAIRAVGAGPYGSSKEFGRAPGGQAEEASGYQIQRAMRAPMRLQDRVASMASRLDVFQRRMAAGGQGFGSFWPYHAHNDPV
jgi:predicted aspartyl protease